MASNLLGARCRSVLSMIMPRNSCEKDPIIQFAKLTDRPAAKRRVRISMSVAKCSSQVCGNPSSILGLGTMQRIDADIMRSRVGVR